MLVLHANWTAGALRLWGESLQACQTACAAALSPGVDLDGAENAPPIERHRFAATVDDLSRALEQRVPALAESSAAKPSAIHLRLPADASGPWPSERLARMTGAVDRGLDPALGEFEIPALAVPNDRALATLLALDEDRDLHDHELVYANSLDYWMAVGRFVIDLLADQRFTPALLHGAGTALSAAWQPWFHDDDGRARVGALLAAMPPSVRAAIDDHHGRPWAILEEAMRAMTDATVRSILANDSFADAIEDRDLSDPHVAWLGGLLGERHQVVAHADSGMMLLRDAGTWINRLDDTGQGRPLHLCLRLNEPSSSSASKAGRSNGEEDARWTLSLHLQAADDARVLLDAAQIWTHPAAGQRIGAHRVDQPQELLLSEMARAARLYPKIESALTERAPTQIALTTAEAYEFLREMMPVLEESGFGVIAPAWWDQPMGQLSARLHVESPVEAPRSAGTAPPSNVLGLNSLVRYQWQVAVGDHALSPDEFRTLVREKAPLVQVHGQWIEINRQQLVEAQDLLAKSSEGEMTLLEAIHVAHGVDGHHPNLHVSGMDATGWVADVLGASADEVRMPKLEQPGGFIGALRPYQKTGLSWLAFLDRYGLGACLADDMGLGKTIQLIALLQHEREESRNVLVAGFDIDGGLKEPAARTRRLAPTLLIVPTSLVANWTRELQRFAPELTVHVQHGPERPTGDRFLEIAGSKDLVITTYPLVSRDHDSLKRMLWHRVALDEAQYIKNPPTKQTTAIRSLHAPRRLALTGTPVENRLSELWSIMEFCNPGYLGSSGEFRRRFSMAIERRRDPLRAEHLKKLVRPFVLRRLKTDPKVIDDLPPCLETKEYATLTPEQAALYQNVVDSMLGQVERADGMRRRGLVLATLVRLKQICNHPQQLEMATAQQRAAASSPAVSPDQQQASNPMISQELGAIDGAEDGPAREDVVSSIDPHHAPLLVDPHRSGKAMRLLTMLEEVLATGEKALIFTQFRQMGHLLTAMIQKELDCEALFLHGGTPAGKRQHLIDRFQSPTGGAPVFVLSLKAGGVGLNLTAANHVFHFDRWWNPAVENQATDRAFRIGQTRTVHVHKFVCVGTLEERIDQMIEQKTELARNIIGAGEAWLTELSTGQLRDLLMLRSTATEGDS